MSGVPVIGGLVGGGKKTTIIQTKPVPSASATPASDQGTADALAAAAEAERRARGRAANILTGGQGLLGGATVASNVLLGS